MFVEPIGLRLLEYICNNITSKKAGKFCRCWRSLRVRLFLASWAHVPTCDIWVPLSGVGLTVIHRVCTLRALQDRIYFRILKVHLHGAQRQLAILKALAMLSNESCTRQHEFRTSYAVTISSWVWFALMSCQHDDGCLYDLYDTHWGQHRWTDTGSQRSVFPDDHLSKY